MNNPLDKLNRPVKDLRISVTDRCNFRCTYCMPKEVYGESFKFLPKDELLDFDEIYRIADTFAKLGVNKIRLTGGEPLVRRNIEELIAKLSKIKGIDDIAMTTNAYLLEPKLDSLIDAGLNRLTVSLDSIDNETFKKMSGQNVEVSKVLSAIDQANKKGFQSIKINCVIQKNVNEPYWISNTKSRQLVHKWRSEEQAILVGAKTIREDDPRLTTRDWEGKNCDIYILSKNGVQKDYKIFNQDSKVTILDSQEIDYDKDFIKQICDKFYDDKILSIIVEGGTKTLLNFIKLS